MNRQALITKRASFKAALTIQQNAVVDFTINSLDEYNQLALRLEHITNIYPRFDDVQIKIQSLEEG